MRIAIIDIPAPCVFINSNQRIHRMAQAKLTKTWREASATAARGVQPFTTQVRIVAHIHKPRGGRYDPGNLYPTAKAILDGIVDAGILTDDDHLHVIGPDMRHGGKGEPRIIIEIEEIS
jgi:crossover junction endodeoxyribonuclease RusA